MAQINDTRGRTAEPSRYNFTILLGNGSFVDLANQLSNPQVVPALPLLCIGISAGFRRAHRSNEQHRGSFWQSHNGTAD
jgi:hypothetical protein